ncbi:MAG TPA: protein kinase, partial [Oculatellaceae cyanobacterium]
MLVCQDLVVETPDQNMLGRLLDGRYQVVQVLSAGGFGKTYIAEDTRRPGNPKCVVKHLKPASNEPNYLQTARRLFLSEAETLEQLGNHDQIPRLLAYFEEDREFFLVQEFIEGHPLSTELQPGDCWSESQVIGLLKDILGILAFVHSYEVIHRDIKPDNLIRRASDGKLV